MTDYNDCLEAAGMDVEVFGRVGDYQGDWYAVGTWQGRRVVVTGSYGSCSGCDALESEDPTTPEEIRAFGMRYLVEAKTPDEWREEIRNRGRYYDSALQREVEAALVSSAPLDPEL
jgi:hypothetical protein